MGKLMIFVVVCVVVAVAMALVRRMRKTPDDARRAPRSESGAGQATATPAEASKAEARKLVSVQSAGRRLYCLTRIVMRGEFEMVMELAKSQLSTEAADVLINEHAKLAQELNSWLKTVGLWDSLSTKENVLMSKPPGDWSEQERINASWRTEAASVIAWSLGLVDALPAYDESFTDGDLLEAVAGILKPVQGKIRLLELRPEKQIIKARDVAELWLWRARTTTLQRDPERYKPPDGMTFDQIIRMTSAWAQADGLFQPIETDFPAFGKAFRNLDDQEWSQMQSTAEERLWGLNWICGYESNWDEVPLGT
jgi:hypothetical protein